MKLKINLIIFGGLAWLNVLSAVFAKAFWAKIYDGLANRFDLTYAEVTLIIPVISITLCIATGIVSAYFFVKKIKSKNLLSASSENVAGGFCLSAFLFYAALNIHNAPIYSQMVSNIRIEQTGRATYETGQVLNGQYVNDSHGFNFQVPIGWGKASWSALERKKANATFSLFSSRGKSISTTDLIPKHVDGIDTLAAILKYSPESGSYNPSLVINVNDKQLMLEKYGVSNLFDFAKMLTKVSPPFVVDEFPRPANIAGRRAFLLKIISNRNGITINQKIFTFETNSAYLEFVASSIDEADAANLLASVDTIKFTK